MEVIALYFYTNTADGSPVADFVYDGNDFTAENGVIAVYSSGTNTAEMYHKSVLFNIPEEQYAIEGSYDRDAVTAVAYSTGNTLHFKNANTLLKFIINPEGVYKVRFSSRNGCTVTGQGSLYLDENGNVKSVTEGYYPLNDYVELSVATGEALKSGASYYISVMPNTLEQGFIIELLDASDSVIVSKEYVNSIQFTRNRIIDLGALGELPYSDKMYVVGTYNEWSHDTSLFLYDFDGNREVYEGVVDFNTNGNWKAESNEFKLTGGDWGVHEHSQSAGDYLGKELNELLLIEGGGDNINAYQAKRFYHFTFDRSAGTLKKNYAFNSIGVIGGFCGWDQDVDMNYNPETQKFWADIDVTENGYLKFRLDDAWDVSFGTNNDMGDLGGTDNISVSAGQYRVYVDMNDLSGMTYVFDANAYGTEENAGQAGSGDVDDPEPNPEPEPVVGWALIGEFNSWNGDELMTEIESGLWAITGFALEAGQQWKIRKDGNWNTNRGAEGSLEPYYISVGEPIIAVAGGKNIAVETSGVYDIYYNANDETLTVLKH